MANRRLGEKLLTGGNLINRGLIIDKNLSEMQNKEFR